MSRLVLSALAGVLTLAGAFTDAAWADEGCKPVDGNALPAEARIGRKAWIFDTVNTHAFEPPAEWTKADAYELIGPGNWVKSAKLPRLEYGQPVEIVEWRQVGAGLGQYQVRLPDGAERAVHAQTVHLFEFWRCPPSTLLEKRLPNGPTKPAAQYMPSAWVRIANPKATAVDGARRWIPEERLAKIGFAICNNYEPNIKRFRYWEEPLTCQGFTPGEHGALSFTIYPSAVETISPTSMKILFSS